jgi:hypothetical protein
MEFLLGILTAIFGGWTQFSTNKEEHKHDNKQD